MRKFLIILNLIFVMGTTTGWSQRSHYDWSKVDSLLNIDYSKQAMELSEKYHDMALSQGDCQNVIVSYLYYLRSIQNYLEDYQLKGIKYIEEDLPRLGEPCKAFAQGILAHLYYAYYRANMYKIISRSYVVKADKLIDEWAIEDFAQKIHGLFTGSLSHRRELARLPISDYPLLIEEGTLPVELRPTVFDFIANWAIDFYEEKTFSLVHPIDRFRVDNPKFFADAGDFVKLKLKTVDTLDVRYNVLQIYQWLLAQHLSDNQVNALIDADIARLKYVWENYELPDADSLYQAALERLIKKYDKARFWRVKLAKYELASFYYRKGMESRDNELVKRALSLVEQILATKTDKQAVSLARSLKDDILAKNLSIDVEENVLSNSDFLVKITYQNLSQPVNMRIYKLKGYDQFRDYLNDDDLGLIFKKTPVLARTITLPQYNDYFVHSAEFLQKGLDYGYYLMVLSMDKSYSFKSNILAVAKFHVTDLALVSQGFWQKRKVWIYDRHTGQPLVNQPVTVIVKRHTYGRSIFHKKLNLQTNDQGQIEFPLLGNWTTYRVVVNRGRDKFIEDFSGYSNRYEEPQSTEKLKLFLDRAIYRPGQIVYFKGIVYSDGGKRDFKVLTGKKITLRFYDANYQEVKTQTFVTDEYGTFSGNFVIPQVGLTGIWRISSELGSKSFRVEEYKRPQFEVKFLPIKQIVAPGEEVEVVGQALNYSGVALDGAIVEYQVKTSEQKLIRWFWPVSEDWEVVKQGKIKTGADGKFKISFVTKKTVKDGLMYHYQVYVKVTDKNGETHSATTGLYVSNQTIILSSDIGQWHERSKKLQFSFDVQNILGQDLTSLTINYKIEKLQPQYSHPLIKRLWQMPDTQLYSVQDLARTKLNIAYNDSILDPDNWPVEKIVQSGQVKGKQEISFNPGKNGVYKVVAIVKDPVTHKDVKFEQVFNVYQASNDRAIAPYPLYAVAVDDTLQPQQTARVVVGSGWKHAKALVQVTYNNKILIQKYLQLNDNQRVVSFPVTEDMRGDVAVNIWLVKNNRSYSKFLTLKVPYIDRKLDVKVERFVDKLEPGQNVTWSFVITGKNGKGVLAQVLASMYDASLDAFVPNKWSFGVFGAANSLIKPDYSEINHIGESNQFNRLEQYYYPGQAFTYPQFNWHGLRFYNYGFHPVYRTTMRRAKHKLKAVQAAEDQRAELQHLQPLDLRANENVENIGQTEGQQVEIRENFAETAFFYPKLMTNQKGEVVIQFKVPESLTKWRFQLFANTTDLFYGLLSREAQTIKDLMVYPNVPRFVRQGDTLYFSAKIANKSYVNLDVTVSLQLTDANSGKVLNIIQSPENQDLTIEKHSSKQVSWKIAIPKGQVNPLIYTVIAKSGKYSDGQRDIIPVLSNRILVTETQPLPVNGMETRTFTITKLLNKNSNSVQPYKFTFEFNSNPVWYAITALPYMMEYPHECNEQLFERFYANTLASYIANSDPNIKRVFEIWKKTKSQALVSELEKKQQLKQIVLEATPWLLDGLNETEQRQRIAILFDINNMANEQQAALRKLFKNQNPDGGWPWFRGGKSSWFVTQYILIGFARLREKNVFHYTNYAEQLYKAFKFTGKKAVEYYNELKKWYSKKELEENHLSPFIVQYLYMCSLYPDWGDELFYTNNEAAEYFYGQLKKYWNTLDLYSQAQAAMTLYNFEDDADLAKIIMESFKQRALYNEEMGYYWAANKPGWFWYQAPIETQAQIIQAFNLITHDTAFIEGAKRWLLKQKQTTHWPTTISTAEAIWTLIFTGYNWLAENEPVQIKLGDLDLTKNIQNTEAGTGYFMKVWDAGQITSDMGKITVTNPNRHPAWGAVYFQYFQDIDKISAWNTNLKIRREFYLQVKDSKGEHLQPITAQTPIKVGDVVVVRLVIETDRNLEFVHIKDLRPTGFEPVSQMSGYEWKYGFGYYRSIRDASANFFVDYLPKGKYVFEYKLFATVKGDLSGGMTTIQCMYAPEFAAHSKGSRVQVR